MNEESDATIWSAWNQNQVSAVRILAQNAAGLSRSHLGAAGVLSASGMSGQAVALAIIAQEEAGKAFACYLYVVGVMPYKVWQGLVLKHERKQALHAVAGMVLQLLSHFGGAETDAGSESEPAPPSEVHATLQGLALRVDALIDASPVLLGALHGLSSSALQIRKGELQRRKHSALYADLYQDPRAEEASAVEDLLAETGAVVAGLEDFLHELPDDATLEALRPIMKEFRDRRPSRDGRDQ